MASLARPKRSVKRPDYRKLADLNVPKLRKITGVKRETSNNTEKISTQLFRLQVIDENADSELVKVHYVGYDSRFDEWRPKSDLIDLNDDTSLNRVEGNELSENLEDIVVFNGPVSIVAKPFSLYEELAYRIKSLFLSTRKGDPVCCTSMTFDTIHFDDLIRRGTLVKGQQTVYTLSPLTKLDDILGERWYIRGINAAGDFCYVKPGTVRYQLRFVKGRPDFQVLEDGTLQEYTYGQRYQLTFKFIRIDSILSQWHDVIKLCKK